MKADNYYGSIKNKQKTHSNFSLEKRKDYLFHLAVSNENMLITICIGHVTDPISEVSGSKHDFAKKNVAIMSHSHPQFSSLILPLILILLVFENIVHLHLPN